MVKVSVTTGRYVALYNTKVYLNCQQCMILYGRPTYEGSTYRDFPFPWQKI